MALLSININNVKKPYHGYKYSIVSYSTYQKSECLIPCKQ